MSVRLEAVNAKLVRQGLENLEKALPEIGRLRLYRLAQRVSEAMKYTRSKPPPRGRYRRTFEMMQSRRIEKTEEGYLFYIDAIDTRKKSLGQPYSVYVLGDMVSKDRQAWMHRGRWPTLQETVLGELEKEPPEIIKALGLEYLKETQKANNGIG